MSGFRPSAHLRHLHDELRCPDDCPLCARIEAQEPDERGARDYLITTDYEDPRCLTSANCATATWLR
jgi:murein endopeptidase